MLAAVNSLNAVSGAAGANATALNSAPQNQPASASASPFSDLIGDAVGQVNQLEAQAHAALTGLMTGSGVDVHQAVIAAQKSEMSFELALAVRNKAVQAYQSVMGMQF